MKEGNNQQIYIGGGLAFVLYIIAFWGEPDLVDALILFLTK